MSKAAASIWKNIGLCILLAALVWLVFGQTLRHQFVNFDDGTYVYKNPDVIRGITGQGLKQAFTHVVAANWHPVTMLSHMLDCQLFGVAPGGHHFTNVFLHATATILLFLVVWAMTQARWRSAFIAAVFAVHPLHVESVAWIAERKDVLSAIFFMLTIGAYVQFVRRPSRVRYLMMSLCFVLGLMTKPMLVTLPFVLLLLDYWPLNRLSRSTTEPAGAERRRRESPRGLTNREASQSIGKLVLEKSPLFVLAAASSLVTIFSQYHTINRIKTVSLGGRIANAFVSLMIYLGQTVWPHDLAAFYPHPEKSLPLWQAGLSFALFAFAGFAAFALRKKAPYVLTGWFWYVGMLVPVIGIVQVGIQAHADRYMYLPQIGLSFIFAWTIANLVARLRRRELVSSALSIAVLVPLTWCAWVQTSYWRDSESLWTHALAVAPDNQNAREHLSNAYLDKGRIDDAIAQGRQAIALQPESANAQATLGAALARGGKGDEAISHLRTALEWNPKITRAHYNLANVLLQKGEVDEAIENYEAELKIQSTFAEGHNNLASALFRKGKLEEAQAHLRSALELNPSYAEARNNFAIALSQKGQMREAISQWEKALKIQPDNLEAEFNLAWVYATFPDASIRNGSRALELAQRALQLSDGKNARIWRLAAAAYAEAGEFPLAIKAAENALALAQAAGDPALIQILESNIQLLRQNAPLRDVASTATAPH